MASKSEASSKKPTILDILKKTSQHSLSENTDFQYRKPPINIFDGLTSIFNGVRNTFNKTVTNEPRNLEEIHSKDFKKGVLIKEKPKSGKSNSINSRTVPAFRLLHYGKLAARHSSKGRKLSNPSTDKSSNSAKSNIDKSRHLDSFNDSLNEKLKAPDNVLSSTNDHIEDKQVQKKTGYLLEQKLKKTFKTKSIPEKQRSFSPIDRSGRAQFAWTKPLNTPSASGKINILNENSKIDQVDVLSLSNKSLQISNGSVIGIFGIAFFLVLVIYWVKNITFGKTNKTSTNNQSYTKKEKIGFLKIEFQKKISSDTHKKQLLVLHNQNRSSAKINTKYSGHLTRIMDDNTETHAGNYDKNTNSNKSTPYFTPLSTLDEGHSRFEFPLPSPSNASLLCSNEELVLSISPATSSATKSINAQGSRSKLMESTAIDTDLSPTRRLRRCSLYERRSCSPQSSQVSNLLANRFLCKSQMDTYEKVYNSANILSNPIHSTISTYTLNSSPTFTPPPIELSSRQFCLNRQNCRSPKIYENPSVDIDGDKENEVPIQGSPILKSNEQYFFNQNSPRILEVSPTSATNFTFSPKAIDKTDFVCVTGNFATIKSSPSISSAGYKNGDYFKFPEVDCFSPNMKKLSSSGINDQFIGDELQIFPMPANLQDMIMTGNSADSRASRRARLKSISLDSEGAKLVEDNLGVPVEELIERSNTASSDFFTNDSLYPSTPCKTNTIYQNNDNLQSSPTINKNINRFDCIRPTDSGRTQKNKNNLIINIGGFTDATMNWEKQPQIKNDTPKTPTLVQTKQKANSLDSSDSKYTISSSYNKGENNANSANVDRHPLGVSLIHISSLSMPGTPKKQLLLNNANVLNRTKLSSGIGGGNQKLKGRQFSSSKSLTPSTPSTSSFDHSKGSERQAFILKLDSFNETSMDNMNYEEEEAPADEDDENYFLSFDEAGAHDRSMNVVSFPLSKTNACDGSSKKMFADCSLGASLQTQKCTSALSLSNTNLKTLPEVMTLSDFSVTSQDEATHKAKGSASNVGQFPSLSAQKQMLFSGRSVKSSILQRRGSNHSLTLNLNGSYGSLSKGLSTSNYSLSSNSQYNMSNSIYNLSQQQPGSNKTAQTLFLKGNSMGMSSFVQNSAVVSGISNGPSGTTVCSVEVVEKKNLLQRRGSNTSLTLNIQGSPCVNLNRFNSHNSLNMASQSQYNTLKMQHTQLKDSTNIQSESNEKLKKGLLERRGSNASLTINLQSHGLAVSNINSRGSACSLSSINTNHLEDEYECREQQDSAFNLNTIRSSNNSKNRKFFSSENLNSLNGMTQYSKLNQAHMRCLSKTCFGSVSDLKPYCQLPLSLIIGEEQETHFKNQIKDSDAVSDMHELRLQPSVDKDSIVGSCISNFKQSSLCSCTGVRNITTRPLSPQATSEDFKMYLANIQLLQNASNVLNEYDLIKLNFIFDKSYGNFTEDINNAKSTEGFEEKQWKLMFCSDFQLELPVEEKQKQLLRDLHQEFWDLPTNHQEKPMVFGSQTKNRYKSILPNEHSRVLLLPEEGNMDAPYINANYIKGPDYVHKSYIATQGPLPNTIYDFWLMVFQNIHKHDEQKSSYTVMVPSKRHEIDESKCFPSESKSSENSSYTLNSAQQKIVMLTNFVENNRPKCSAYFPIDENETFLITYTNEQIKNTEIEIYYDQYFKSLKNNQSIFDIETLEIEINDKKLIDHLPKNNYFIIKNMGIVMKNGFSIRQLYCLFCCNLVQTSSLSGTIDYSNEIIPKRIQVLHKFKCYHYWYPDWPDHRSPSDISVLLEISQHLLSVGKCEAEFCDDDSRRQLDFALTKNFGEQPLPIIHCSAGIGRTGCMAAILNAICQIKASVSLNPMVASNQMANECTATKKYDGNKSDVDNLQSFPSQSFPYNKLDCKSKIKKNSKVHCEDISQYIEFKKTLFHERSQNISSKAIKKNPSIYVDILGIVCNLRLQRGGMVQNSEQYELIHRAICLYIKRMVN